MKKVFMYSAALIIVAFLLSGCANSTDVTSYTYGFWGGLWHGIISPINFIASFFSNDVLIYAENNNGSSYAVGFVLGLVCLFGGGGKATITINN